MPTWPKDSKASTLNVDAGSDQISQARADIKQNIDNVNTIIDTFDIQPDSAGQPANGDVLQYDSSTTTWKPVASTSVGGGGTGSGGSFVAGTLSGLVTVADVVESISANPPANGFISTINTGTDRWKFSETGTYYWQWLGTANAGVASTFFKIKNVTQSTYTQLQQIQNPTNPQYGLGTLSVTSTSDEYSLVTTSTTSSSKTVTCDSWLLTFYKF